MRYLKFILSFVLFFVWHSLLSQNKAFVETRNFCNCNSNYNKLDSLMQTFGESYKGDFSSAKFLGNKKLDNVFKEKALFFNKQLKVKTFNKSCCSKYSSIYTTLILSEDTLEMNCTVFEYSFVDEKDILEIKRAFEQHNSNYFISKTPYYYRYYTRKNSVYIVSKSSTNNYKNENSVFNRFCDFMANW